jgi:hypothetical protein
MTQCDMILRYMQDTGSITPWEAMREFGCMRLGARIYDLKRRGVAVRTELVTEQNRFGRKVQFARYSVAHGEA